MLIGLLGFFVLLGCDFKGDLHLGFQLGVLLDFGLVLCAFVLVLMVVLALDLFG
jgi:hypothetical protein